MCIVRLSYAVIIKSKTTHSFIKNIPFSCSLSKSSKQSKSTFLSIGIFIHRYSLNENRTLSTHLAHDLKLVEVYHEYPLVDEYRKVRIFQRAL